MRQRRLAQIKKPSMLACALIEDGGRYLFLESKDIAGKSRFELPSVFVYAGEDPVSALQKAILEDCGIDAQVGHAIITGEYRAGSKRGRVLVPALGFTVSAKSYKAVISDRFVAYKWMGAKESLAVKLEKKSEWLKSAKKA